MGVVHRGISFGVVAFLICVWSAPGLAKTIDDDEEEIRDSVTLSTGDDIDDTDEADATDLSLRRKVKRKKRRRKKKRSLSYSLDVGPALAPISSAAGSAIAGQKSFVSTADVRLNTKIFGKRLIWHLRGEHDPFVLKTFDFDRVAGTTTINELLMARTRVTGSLELLFGKTHTNGGGLKLSGSYSDTSDPDLGTRRGALAAFVGKTPKTGLGWRLSGTSYVKIYPHYAVTWDYAMPDGTTETVERKLDQVGARLEPRLSYAFGKAVNIVLVYGLLFRQYIQAQYDSLDQNGTLVPNAKSRSYLTQRISPELILSPSKKFRIRLSYALTLNDARNYNRRTSAYDAQGVRETRFIEGLFDYTRHRAQLKSRWKISKSVVISGHAAYQTRTFKSYIPRTGSGRNRAYLNGVYRVDKGYDMGFEARYAIRPLAMGRAKHTPFFRLNIDYDSRSSNNTYEDSFFTNYTSLRSMLVAGIAL